mgnify:CR=1 FL=1
MRQNCCFMEGDRCDRLVRTDLCGPECPLVHPEGLIELGTRARQEIERFINGNIHDLTKGWPVLSRVP